MKKKNASWTIGKRLWTLSICFFANILIMGGVNYWNSKQLADHLEDLAEVQLPAVKSMTLADMNHDGIRSVVYQAIVASGSRNPEEIENVKKDAEEFGTSIKKHYNELKALRLSDATAKAIAPVAPKIEEYVAAMDMVLKVATRGDVERAIGMLPKFNEKFKELEKELDVLGTLVEKNAEDAAKEGEATVQKTRIISWVLVALGLVIGFFNAAWVIRDLQRRLKEVMNNLGTEAKEVTGTSGTLYQSAQALASSNVQQASALQETAASIDEITAMVKKTGDNSRQLEKTAQESHRSAAKGQDSIQQMLSAMVTISESNTKIMNQVEHGNQQITEIVKVIGEIGNKTKVINDIVFKTQLLSFNASVEAARAGEHGKGFAVVAEEVGNLAQMSGNAAKEISDMLTSSIAKVEGIVTDNRRNIETLISDGKARLETGTTVAKQCGTSLDEIVKQSADVGSMITEISTAIEEQNLGIQEISKAIGLLDQSTQKNAATSGDTHRASQSLVNQAENLKEVVNALANMVEGRGSHQFSEANDSFDQDTPTAPSHSLPAHSENVSNVIPFRAAKADPSPSIPESMPAKAAMAVGSNHVPAENDPRFEDV